MADETKNIIVENTTRNADSIEIGTLSKGGYSRTIKLYRDLNTPEGRQAVKEELKALDDSLKTDFPTPNEMGQK